MCIMNELKSHKNPLILPVSGALEKRQRGSRGQMLENHRPQHACQFSAAAVESPLQTVMPERQV